MRYEEEDFVWISSLQKLKSLTIHNWGYLDLHDSEFDFLETIPSSENISISGAGCWLIRKLSKKFRNITFLSGDIDKC